MRVLRVELVHPETNEAPSVLAYARVQLEAGGMVFRIIDFKLYFKNSGQALLAMPERSKRKVCPRCGNGNPYHYKFCFECGEPADVIERPWYRDIVIPGDRKLRDFFGRAVWSEFVRVNPEYSAWKGPAEAPAGPPNENYRR